MKKQTRARVLAFVTLLSLGSCTETPQKPMTSYSGKWEYKVVASDNEKKNELTLSSKNFMMEVYAKKTPESKFEKVAVQKGRISTYGTKMKFIFKEITSIKENGKIKIMTKSDPDFNNIVEYFPKTFEYKIDGDSLTLTFGGNRTTFTRTNDISSIEN